MTTVPVEQSVAEPLEISHHAYVLENGDVVLSSEEPELLRGERVRLAYLG